MAQRTSGQGLGFNEHFDSRLMKGQADSSSEKAGALNEAKRQGDDNTGTQEPQTLREAVMAERRAAAKKEQEGESKGLVSKAAAPAKKATNKLLQSAWEYLIPSFGLTLIWINIHVFLRIVIGKNFFCKLGEEWLDMMPGGASSASQAMAGAAGGEMKDKLGGCANLAEGFILFILDLLVFVILIGIFAIISGLLQIFDLDMKALGATFGYIWDAGANAIKSLVSS